MSIGKSQDRRILGAIDSYNEDAFVDELFEQVGERIRINRHATKLEISALAAWKRLTLSTPWIARLQSMPDSTVKEVTARALGSSLSLHQRLDTLAELDGFKARWSVASTVLSAWSPEDFAVVDQNAWRALKRLGLVPEAARKNYERYMSVIDELRMDLSESGRALPAREVDKGLFTLGRGLPRS